MPASPWPNRGFCREATESRPIRSIDSLEFGVRRAESCLSSIISPQPKYPWALWMVDMTKQPSSDRTLSRSGA